MLRDAREKNHTWSRMFGRQANPQLSRPVTIEAVPALFGSPDRPNDRVAAFVVAVENGGTVRLTEAEPRATTTARMPVEPFLTGAPLPPVRYRTETWWASGGIGVSGLESDGSQLFYCGGGASGKVRAVRRPKRAET